MMLLLPPGRHATKAQQGLQGKIQEGPLAVYQASLAGPV